MSNRHSPARRSIRITLTLSFVLLAIIPSLVFVTTIILASFEQSYRLTIDQFQSLADTKISSIERLINNGEDVLSLTLSDTRQYPRMLETVRLADARLAPIQQMNDYLQQKLDGQSIFTTLFIYSRTGEIRASTDAGLIGEFVSAEPFYADSLNGFYLQPPYFNDQGQIVLLLTDVIRDERSNVVGVLAGQVDLQLLNDLMVTAGGVGETGDTYLVSAENGLLITPSRFSDILPAQAYTSAGIDAALAGESGASRYSSFRGVDVIGVYRWLPQLQAAMLLEISQAEANGILSQVLVLSLVVAVLVAAGAFVLGLLLTQWLVRPLRVLTQTASAIAEGDIQQRVKVQRNNEIGQLADSFNSMADQLSTLINTLEHRVQERTRDLRVSAEVSRQVTTLLQPEELLTKVVEQTREAFNLYYVGVFVRDEDTLRLRAATGDAGRQMLADGKHFNIDDPLGLVPQAAREQRPALENDVQKSERHLVNSLLPATRAEVTLPMLFAGRVIGVLDLQSELVNRFTKSDIEVFAALADQLSVALRNAELFVQTQAALAEAERSNNVKSAFLANVSHELRTPLNAILNFSQFIARGMVGPINAEQVDLLDKISASGKHLLSLINDVLDISKIESGSLRLFIEEGVDLTKELEVVVATTKALLNDKPVEMVVRVDQDLPLITGDKRRMRQIMLNLVSNACKFTSMGQIIVSLEQQQNRMLFSVQDSGPGIAPEDHATIFEAFRQADAGIRQGEGTGLGLAISRRLVEAHQGQLWLESTLGKGSTFYAAFPLQPVVETPALQEKHHG